MLNSRKVGPVVATLASLIASCAAPGLEDGRDETTQSNSEALSTGRATTQPKPVAALNLKNGNTLEFYEFERGALLMEQGIAGTTTPVLDASKRSSDDLVSIWNELATDGLDRIRAHGERRARLQQRLLRPELAECATLLPRRRQL